MKKTILASLIFVSLVQTVPKPVFAENFPEKIYNDVDEKHWAYKALSILAEKYNLEFGYPDGSFRGNAYITRYETVTMLLKIAGLLKENPSIEENDLSVIENLYYQLSLEIKEINEKNASIEDQLDLLEMRNIEDKNTFEAFSENFPITLNGSIGFRYQLVTAKPGDFSNSLPQSRVSIGFKNKTPGLIDYGAEMVTGANNRPGNTWWKLGDFFIRPSINLNKFFISYNPYENFSITLGKFENPFSNSELFFDEEITLQGALQRINLNNTSSGLGTLTLNFGEIVVNMDNKFGNTFMLAGNSNYKLNISDFIGLNFKAGYYQFLGEDSIAKANKISETSTPVITGNMNSNSLDETGLYSTGFSIINGFAKVIFRISENLPLTISGDYFYNTAASARNQAFQINSKLGHSRNPGNFFIGYNFKYLEKDAVISLFVEDQLGKTDVIAHEGLFGIKLHDNTILSLTLQSQNSMGKSGENLYTLRTNLLNSF